MAEGIRCRGCWDIHCSTHRTAPGSPYRPARYRQKFAAQVKNGCVPRDSRYAANSTMAPGSPRAHRAACTINAFLFQKSPLGTSSLSAPPQQVHPLEPQLLGKRQFLPLLPDPHTGAPVKGMGGGGMTAAHQLHLLQISAIPEGKALHCRYGGRNGDAADGGMDKGLPLNGLQAIR